MRAERALRESEERFALAVKACNDGIWDWDLRKNELYLSPRWKELIGFGDDELPSEPDSWLGRVHPEDRPQVESAIRATREGTSLHLSVEHRMLHRDGSYRWMLARGVGQRSAGVTMRLTGSQTDLTDRKLVDPVTGLPNRAVFQQKLAAAERADNGRGTSFALLLCNLDRFKLVNDSFGLSLGDQALTAMGRMLRDSVRDVGFLAHLGGDEFAILVTASCAPAEALQLGDAILEMLRAPLTIGSETIEIAASIGIALSTGEGGEAALRDAQVALRRAKEAGGGKAELFEPKMQQDARQRLDLERDLRQALRGGDLVPNFQPIVSLTDGRIVGFEALARWDRGGGKGMVAPAEFIPVAEETGLIKSVDQHILARACAEARRWHDGRSGGPFVSVNLSAKQVGDPGLVAATLEQIKEHGLEPRHIKLEITESAIMNDPDAAAAAMAELVGHGVGLAIDDFGTGYCSLAYLHRFPADTLKIDRYFVSQMDGGAHGLGIVSAIIDLAHGLGMAVVAEGIETPAQRDALRHLGCDYGQGYLFSRPVAADTAAKLLEGSAAA
jgi:diguanylate cyclase (GGDEF)-like protein/PAS domain S-box-containing protein